MWPVTLTLTQTISLSCPNCGSKQFENFEDNEDDPCEYWNRTWKCLGCGKITQAKDFHEKVRVTRYDCEIEEEEVLSMALSTNVCRGTLTATVRPNKPPCPHIKVRSSSGSYECDISHKLPGNMSVCPLGMDYYADRRSD